MAARIIIPKQTAEVTTEALVRVQGLTNPAIIAEGLGAGDTIPIFKTMDDGATFEQVQQDGAPVELTQTNNVFAVEVAMLLAVTKPDTSPNLVGVFLTSDQQI